MIVARIEHGQIQACDPIPPEWEGRLVTIAPATPDHPHPDVEAALAAFHALGPMEFEEGEREEMERLLLEMDRVSQVGFEERTN